MKVDVVIVVMALIIGAYLRFANLGQLPFWCDEAYYATNVYQFESPQEFLPAALGHVLIAADCYMNHMSRWLFQDTSFDKYRQFCYDGGVVVFRFIKLPDGFKVEEVTRSK